MQNDPRLRAGGGSDIAVRRIVIETVILAKHAGMPYVRRGGRAVQALRRVRPDMSVRCAAALVHRLRPDAVEREPEFASPV